MSAPSDTQPLTDPALLDPEHGLPPGFGEGRIGRALFWTAVSFSLFQIATAFNLPLGAKIGGGLTLVDAMRLVMIGWLGFIVSRRMRGGDAAQPAPRDGECPFIR